MIDRPYDSFDGIAPLTRGTISRRVIAFVLDGIILLIAVKLLAGLLLVFGVLTFGLGFPLLGLLPAVPVFYNWLSLLTGLSATPGQAMTGLVVRRNDDLGPPTAFAALIWVIGFYVSIAFSGLPFLLALFTARRRTAHDLISGLVVVRAHVLTARPGFWNMRPGGSPFA